MCPSQRALALLVSSLVGCALLDLGRREAADLDELLALGAQAGAEDCPARTAAPAFGHRAMVRAAPVDSPPSILLPRPKGTDEDR